MSYEKVKESKKLVVGANQCCKAIRRGRARELIVAADADTRVTSKPIALAKEQGVPITCVDSMHALGRACGIEVPASAVVLLKEDQD